MSRSMMFDSLLIVCTANLCRSPIAQGLMQRTFVDKHILSAGLMVNIAKPIAPLALSIAQQHGLDLSQHKATSLTQALCLHADLILVMENWQLHEVANYHFAIRGKVFLFGHWLNHMEIPDPFGKEHAMFEHTYSLLEQATQSWFGRI